MSKDADLKQILNPTLDNLLAEIAKGKNIQLDENGLIYSHERPVLSCVQTINPGPLGASGNSLGGDLEDGMAFMPGDAD